MLKENYDTFRYLKNFAREWDSGKHRQFFPKEEFVLNIYVQTSFHSRFILIHQASLEDIKMRRKALQIISQPKKWDDFIEGGER